MKAKITLLLLLILSVGGGYARDSKARIVNIKSKEQQKKTEVKIKRRPVVLYRSYVLYNS